MPTLNVRLAAILLVSVIIVGGGVHLLHGFQVGRQANALKVASERAEKDRTEALAKAASATTADEKTDAKSDAAKDLADAVKLLRDYVFLSRDRRAELHLGTLYVESGMLRQACDCLEEGLRKSDDAKPPLSPDEIREARWKLAKDVELKMGLVSDARKHLLDLLDGAVEKNQRHRQNREKPEGDPEQLELYGQILRSTTANTRRPPRFSKTRSPCARPRPFLFLSGRCPFAAQPKDRGRGGHGIDARQESKNGGGL